LEHQPRKGEVFYREERKRDVWNYQAAKLVRELRLFKGCFVDLRQKEVEKEDDVMCCDR